MNFFTMDMCIIKVPHFIHLTEGGETHNGDEDSSESDGDEPSLSQEPKAPRNPSTGGGSQPGSAVHKPRGTQPTAPLINIYTLLLGSHCQ